MPSVVQGPMKMVDVVFTLLLVVFAALQVNDPDPWIWGSVYAAAALVPGLALFNRLNLALTLFVMAVCLVRWPLPGPCGNRP